MVKPEREGLYFNLIQTCANLHCNTLLGHLPQEAAVAAVTACAGNRNSISKTLQGSALSWKGLPEEGKGRGRIASKGTVPVQRHCPIDTIRTCRIASGIHIE
jgi:hypothetical protein